MPIFTVEVVQGGKIVDRFIAEPFHRDGNELVNSDPIQCLLTSDDSPRVRFYEPVSELLIGESLITGPWPTHQLGLDVAAGDTLEIPPGRLRVSFHNV